MNIIRLSCQKNIYKFTNTQFPLYKRSLQYNPNFKLWHDNKLSLSLYTKEELKFTNYEHHKNGNRLLFSIFGLNVAVFFCWIASQEDVNLNQFMNKYFIWKNIDRKNLQGDKEHSSYLANYMLCSFSHQTLDHIVSNMFMFGLLAPKLYKFLGPYKFLTLYLGGCVAGSIGSNLSIGMKPENIETQEYLRHQNILDGQDTGYCASLGASDSVMALVAAFYFTFPRHQLFVNKTAYFLKLKQFRLASIWLLPLYFVGDFFELTKKKQGQVNNYAHVGGFLWGSLFHFFIGRPLKSKYHQPVGLDVRRFYLMSISLALYTLLSLLSQESDKENQKSEIQLLGFQNVKQNLRDKEYEIQNTQLQNMKKNINDVKQLQKQFKDIELIKQDNQITIQGKITGNQIYEELEKLQECIVDNAQKPVSHCDKSFHNFRDNLTPLGQTKHIILLNIFNNLDTDTYPIKQDGSVDKEKLQQQLQQNQQQSQEKQQEEKQKYN